MRHRIFNSAVRAAILWLAITSLACLIGCVTPAFPNSPRRLLEQAHSALEKRDLEAAFGHLAQIRQQHPDSAESAEAFALAATIFRRSYFRNRYTQPDSHWVTAEPAFMLDWLASFFQGPDFPQAQAEALFIGMHYGYFRDFLAYAVTRPELSRWAVQAEDDNGIIEVISAERSEGPAS